MLTSSRIVASIMPSISAIEFPLKGAATARLNFACGASSMVTKLLTSCPVFGSIPSKGLYESLMVKPAVLPPVETPEYMGWMTEASRILTVLGAYRTKGPYTS